MTSALHKPKRWENAWRRERFDAVYSSDLVRAFHTARPAVPDPDRIIIKDQRLRERHLGVLQGLTGEEAAAGQPAAWKAFKSRDADLALAGGESLGEFSRRVVASSKTFSTGMPAAGS